MDPEQLGAMLLECRKRGFELPLYMCVIGANGAALVSRYTPDEEQEGLKCEFLTDNIPAEGFLVPLNIMISDPTGKAAHVVVERDTWGFADLN
jgi:hypothetical protein